MGQIHKRFTGKQVRLLMQSYDQGEQNEKICYL